MESTTFKPVQSLSTDETEVRTLYQQLIEGWNKRSSNIMTTPFAEDGEIIGFDGSLVTMQTEIESHIRQIFADHFTPSYVSKVRNVRFLVPEVAILNAVAGMVPFRQSDLDPKLNSVQTLIAIKKTEGWRIALFQNTPAQFHGKPELVEKLTKELRELL